MSEIVSKLGKIDQRWLYVFSVILIVIPIISPIGLPVKVSKATRDVYEAIVNLPEGSVIVWEEGGIAGQYDINRPSMVITMKLIFSCPVKLVIFCDSGQGPVLIKDALSIANPERFGKKYGDDYVVFGFAAGGESASASFATNIRNTFSTDYYGTPIDEISLMKGVNSATDVDLIIQLFVGCYNCDWIIRQWVVPYETPFIGLTPGCCTPMIAAYYPAMCKGYLAGSMGATELEILAKMPGEGATISDAKNLGVLPMIIFIILGNIAYFSERSRRKEGSK